MIWGVFPVFLVQHPYHYTSFQIIGTDRCLWDHQRGGSLGLNHWSWCLRYLEGLRRMSQWWACSGSTMSAPTVTMDKIPTLKMARNLKSFGDSGFQPHFLGLFQVMTRQTPMFDHFQESWLWSSIKDLVLENSTGLEFLSHPLYLCCVFLWQFKRCEILIPFFLPLQFVT